MLANKILCDNWTYIYIIILPIPREEVGGLVPKIMFEFWIRHDLHNLYRIHGPSCNGCRVCDFVDTKTFSSTKESGKFFLSLFPWFNLCRFDQSFSRIDDRLLQHIGLFWPSYLSEQPAFGFVETLLAFQSPIDRRFCLPVKLDLCVSQT